MSQTDMTVANGSGQVVREDVEDHLQALASTSLGNSAPSTLYQGQHHIDSDTPSGTIWTEYVWDGAQSIGLWYINTATNVAYPVSALPLIGFSAHHSPVMTGDIRTTAATAVPGASNSTLGYTLAANGSLHLSNNGSYVFSCNRNSNGVQITFGLSGTQVGTISVSGSSTAYNTSSDPRLKTNVETIDWREALAILGRLRPVWFNWRSNPLGNRVDGFLSTEVEDVLPHIVTGERDAVDGEGRIVPQGIDQAKLTPLLTAAAGGAIPFLLDQVAALAARVEALEAKAGE